MFHWGWRFVLSFRTPKGETMVVMVIMVMMVVMVMVHRVVLSLTGLGRMMV